MAAKIKNLAVLTGQDIIRAIVVWEHDSHKLARLIFAILTKGGEYVEPPQEQYGDQMRKITVALGFSMQPLKAV